MQDSAGYRKFLSPDLISIAVIRNLEMLIQSAMRLVKPLYNVLVYIILNNVLVNVENNGVEVQFNISSV